MRSSIIAGIDSLDEQGIFQSAPIIEETFENDLFGCAPLIDKTSSRIKEILDSKPGSELHNEMHFANAIILCFGLASYHLHHGDADVASKMLKEAETLAEKTIKKPLLLGVVYLTASLGFRFKLNLKVSAETEYRYYIEKAFTYVNAVSSDELPALLRQLILSKGHLGLYKHYGMLEKFIKTHIEKIDATKYVMLLLNYYLKPNQDFNFDKIASLLKTIPVDAINHDLVDLFEQRGDGFFNGENQSLWFYQQAVHLIEKMKRKDIARLTRLKFKMYCRAIGASDAKSYQESLEQCILKLSELPLEQRCQFSTSCFQIEDWKIAEDSVQGYYMPNLSKVECILPFALRIFEIYPKKIGDLIELLLNQSSRYADFRQFNEKIIKKSKTEWIKYLTTAFSKIEVFLSGIKKDRKTFAYFTDTDLHQAIVQIFNALSKNIDTIKYQSCSWHNADMRSTIEQIQKFFGTMIQFILKESEPFAHVFPSYLAFRTRLRLKALQQFCLDESADVEIEKCLANEIHDFIEKNKNSASLITLMRPVIAEFLAPAIGYICFGQESWTCETALKGYELANIIKDNQSILKCQIVLASIYTINDFRYDKLISGGVPDDFEPAIGQTAKKFLQEFLANAKQSSPSDLRNALNLVRKKIQNTSSGYFSINDSNILMAALAEKCEKEFMNLMKSLTSEHCLRDQWKQLVAACFLIRRQEDAKSLHPMLLELNQFSTRLEQSQRDDLVMFFKASIGQNAVDPKIKHLQLESLTHFDPVLGWLCLSTLNDKSEVVAKRLYHSAMGLLSDYRKKSTHTLLFQCDSLLDSQLYYSRSKLAHSLAENLIGTMVIVDKALVTVLQELKVRLTTLLVNKTNTVYFIPEIDRKELVLKTGLSILHLTYHQWLLKDEELGNQAFDALKSYMEQNLEFYSQDLEAPFSMIADDLREKQLNGSASMMYHLIIECSSKRNIDAMDYCYKLMDCYLHLKDKDKILNSFKMIFDSLKYIYSEKRINSLELFDIGCLPFNIINKLLEEKFVDQARSWYEFYHNAHEKIYDSENISHHTEFSRQFAKICEGLASCCHDSDKVKYLEKSLLLYLRSLPEYRDTRMLEVVINIFSKLKELESFNDQTQTNYYSVLEKIIHDLGLSGDKSCLSDFFWRGNFLCEKDKTNHSMIALFKQVCLFLLSRLEQESENVKALVEKLTQAEMAVLVFGDLCIPQKMDADRLLIENLRRENKQMRQQLESKSNSINADSNNASNNGPAPQLTGQKRPLEENKPTADDKKTEDSDEPAAKRQKTFHASTLFQQPTAPASDAAPIQVCTKATIA